MLTRDDLIQVLAELHGLGPKDIADHLIRHWPGIVGQPEAEPLHYCHCDRVAHHHLRVQERCGAHDVWLCEAHWMEIADAFRECTKGYI